MVNGLEDFAVTMLTFVEINLDTIDVVNTLYVAVLVSVTMSKLKTWACV